MHLKTLLAATAAGLALVSTAQAANLVVNGDFSAGNTGFGSNYSYVAPGPGALNPPDVYTVDTSPANSHGAFANFGDHTTGSGNMMIINGSQTPGDMVWFENGLSVLANTTYFFSTWIASAHPTSPAQLNFSINGDALGPTFMASATTGLWQQFYATWNSGAATTANIALVNQNLAFSGNDFALDDIMLDTLRPGVVPEPATWAMMIFGFGGIGAVLRTRRRPLLTAV